MALQNLRSSTPSKRPDASSMSDGQIALNTAAASAGLFFKDSNGDLVKTGPVHVGTTAPNSTPATGGSTGNSKGEAWLDTSNNNYVLKIYDGTAFRPVEIAAGSARQLLQTNAAGTDVEFTSNVDVPGTLDVTGVATFDDNVTVSGNLTVNGTTTTIDSTTLVVEDKNIEMGAVTTPSDTTADGGGITLKGATDKTLTWVNSTDCWTFNQALNLTAGTESAPALVFDADVNSGIYHPAADELAISTAGSERLRINSSGLGIGTSNPAFPLEVNRTDTGTVVSSFESATTSAWVNVASTNTDTLNVRIGATGNDAVIQAGGSEAVRIKSDGKVGLGTSSPSQKLEVAANAQHRIAVTATDTTMSNGADYGGFAFFSNDASNPNRKNWDIYQVARGSTGITDLTIDSHETSDIVKITSTGDAGIGTSSPSEKLEVAGNLQLDAANAALKIKAGTTGNRGAVDFTLNTDNTVYGSLELAYDNRSTDGLKLKSGSYPITIEYDSGDYFRVKDSSTERFRINSSGNILCGMSSPAVSSLYTLQATGTRGAIIKSTGGGGNPTQTLWNANSSGDSTLLEFRVNTTDATVGNIVHDRSAGLVDYNTTSDYRAKTLNGRVENSGLIIDQLKVYNGTMNGATIELPMLVAHEAQEVVPYCVTGEKDAVDSEGNPIYQGMDVSKLVPLLIAEIQELRKRLSDAGL